ncbi:hypothetical protein [Sphingomonas sp. PvP018]|uniref:hypothetical protein n=1 Tax=Sphingomonas sp. PvP018 TaxID=2817852 RepID=UPI001AEB5E68|nr:hypothetical protein [Sphingomonas sp. PvP018]MBP2513761.1 hypothetical protein [Sphingomonas sp. PvP018]
MAEIQNHTAGGTDGRPGGGFDGPRFDGDGLRRLISGRARDGAFDVKATFSQTGGALRTLIGSTHRHPIALNRDPQCAYGNPTEGVTERDLSRYFTAHPDVGEHLTQPMKLESTRSGRRMIWFPDYWAQFRDGTLEIGEVKIDQTQMDDEYIEKMTRMREHVEALGCRYRLRYRKDILGGVDRQHNVGMLHFDRDADFEDHHLDRLTILKGLSDLRFGDVKAVLDPDSDHRASAIARRFVCMGLVWVDIDRLITDDSPVVVRGRTASMTLSRLM